MANLDGFNEKQRKAIESDEEKIIIIAPPGSGKTWTMTGAIDRYLEKENPKDVVAVTFTRAAASELKERVFDTNVVDCRTIHSWSLSELNRLSKEHSFRVKILDEEGILNILKPLMKEYGINDRSKYLLYHFVMGNTNIDIYDNVKPKFKAIAERYTKEKRRRKIYDFTDLPLYLKTKLEDYDEYIHLDAIFVDEFQDVDPIQLDVFNRVEAKKKFFIGDPDQAIYMFRGATSNIFSQLKGYEVYNLNINYRSYQNIINYASAFKDLATRTVELGQSDFSTAIIDQFTPIQESQIKTIKGKGGSVLAEFEGNIIYKIGEFQTDFGINYLLQEEIKKEEPQILCRKNKEVKKIKELGYDKVSTIHQAKGLEYKNVIMTNFSISDLEDINIGYVAMTRAQNKLITVDFETLIESLLEIKGYLRNKKRDKQKINSAF